MPIDYQPDWNRIAEKFDLWLPYLAPVGEALIAELDARRGDRILDLACGTGEAALTLARRHRGELTLTGVDAATGMIEAARHKSRREGITDIRFECMAAEQLAFAEESFDRALCRFGLMLFDDPLQALREMYRTLRRRGRFALSVWGAAESMTGLRWAYEVLKDRLPEDRRPPLGRATALGRPATLEALLHDAGFRDFSIETRTLYYCFPSFDAYWDLLEASDMLADQWEWLAAQERAAVREEIRRLAATCTSEAGLIIPHGYLLASGYKP